MPPACPAPPAAISAAEAERADLLVAVDHHFIAEPRRRRSLDRLQRREHHREAALHVGDAGAAEDLVLEPARSWKA